MIITCNRILFPPQVEEDDEVIREAKMKQMARNIRKRKFSFHIADVEKYGEHEDARFTEVWFYYETIVIEMTFDKFDTLYKEWFEENQNQEDEDDNMLRFWIPTN